jgi:hypothetical protein
MTQKGKHEAREFLVETRFEKMAKRPGGLPRDRAIKNAQGMIEELKPEFADWVDRKVQESIAAIRRIEQSPDDVGAIDVAHRICGELRDVGATMGFRLVTAVSGNLCEIFEALKAGAPHHKEALDCHVDALALSVQPPYRNMSPDQVPEMMGGLISIVARVYPNGSQ